MRKSAIFVACLVTAAAAPVPLSAQERDPVPPMPNPCILLPSLCVPIFPKATNAPPTSGVTIHQKQKKGIPNSADHRISQHRSLGRGNTAGAESKGKYDGANRDCTNAIVQRGLNCNTLRDGYCMLIA